jgi:predicted deacetylase
MAVHVTIHDVSPAWEREVDVALDLAHEAGVKPALLVVPDFHGRAKLDEHADFCAKLRELQAAGHEIYLHGYYHRARLEVEGSLADRARHAFAQRVVSGGEAEFSDVSPDEARARLERGERMLEDVGLAIRGFVAPAWSMPRWVLGLLGERGYTFTEDHLRIYDPSARTSRPSLVLNFASRTPSRLFSSVAWCRMARPLARLVPARIAIHPADMRFALLRAEVESALAWAGDETRSGGGFVTSGRELFS